PRRDDQARRAEEPSGASPPRGGGFAAARAVQRPPAAGGHVPRVVGPRGVAVDLFGAGGRADEQRRGARRAARCDLAEAVVWHPERPWQPFRRYGDDGDRGKRSPGEGDGRTVRARERDGYLAAITAVGNTGRCHCFSADYAAPGGRFFARVSPLGVARPDETTGCVGVSDRRAQRSSASLRLSMWP